MEQISRTRLQHCTVQETCTIIQFPWFCAGHVRLLLIVAELARNIGAYKIIFLGGFLDRYIKFQLDQDEIHT